VDKTGQSIAAILKFARRNPAVCVFVPCVAFEAPATAYFARAGYFYELLIVFALFLIQPVVYFAVRKTR